LLRPYLAARVLNEVCGVAVPSDRNRQARREPPATCNLRTVLHVCRRWGPDVMRSATPAVSHCAPDSGICV